MGFDFFSERWLLEVLKITFLLLPKNLFFLGSGCKVGKMVKTAFSKKLKKHSKMIAMVFIWFMVNSYEKNNKKSNETPMCHRPKAQKNKNSKTCQNQDFEVAPSGNFFIWWNELKYIVENLTDLRNFWICVMVICVKGFVKNLCYGHFGHFWRVLT